MPNFTKNYNIPKQKSMLSVISVGKLLLNEVEKKVTFVILSNSNFLSEAKK